MKTPEEIKMGLECCNTYNDCQSCPYDDEVEKGWGCCVQRNADALAYIQQLEAKVPKWISVEERLPEYGRYLVITRKGNAGPKAHTATYNHMGWWTHSNFGDITHWMPLPEPPEEET